MKPSAVSCPPPSGLSSVALSFSSLLSLDLRPYRRLSKSKSAWWTSPSHDEPTLRAAPYSHGRSFPSRHLLEREHVDLSLVCGEIVLRSAALLLPFRTQTPVQVLDLSQRLLCWTGRLCVYRLLAFVCGPVHHHCHVHQFRGETGRGAECLQCVQQELRAIDGHTDAGANRQATSASASTMISR